MMKQVSGFRGVRQIDIKTVNDLFAPTIKEKKVNDPEVFVFGSNLAGRHGRGAALYAKNFHGAIYGQGTGRQGNSYAIPTKDDKLKTIPLPIIKEYVNAFLLYAKARPETKFKLTPIGCGLAGYKPHQVAPMFKGASENVLIPEEFKPYVK